MRLCHQAETLRLARLLGVSADELDFRAGAPIDDLATVRAANGDLDLRAIAGDFIARAPAHLRAVLDA